MKRCPTCARIYEDARLKFCRRDGTALSALTAAFFEDGTRRLPSSNDKPNGLAARGADSAQQVESPLTEDFVTASLLTMPLKKRRSAKSKTIDSLAVLPFISVAQDPQTEYLAEGIAESIINILSPLPKLRVVPRSTAFRYQGRKIDPQTAGRELDVRAVLTGRLVQVGKKLVIKTELIDVLSESQLWGEQYRREITDVFALEEEIAAEISDKLKLRLNREEKKQLAKRYTENKAAYHFYLRGRYYTNKRTTVWIKKGIEQFQTAIGLDENYALAYAGLADAYAFLGSSTGECPPNEWYPKTMLAALKALEIDETLAEAHSSLGFYNMMYEWNFKAARKHFRRAIELNPNYATAHDGYSFYYKATGQHEKAILACRRAQEEDPLSLFAMVSLGWAYYFAGRYDAAIEQNLKALEMDANFAFAYWNLGLAQTQKGDLAEAAATLKRGYELSHGLTFLAHLSCVYGLMGKTGEAKKHLARMATAARKKYVSPYYFALGYLGLGDAEQTFTALNRACDEHASFLAFLNVEPLFNNLRQDPRYSDLRWRIDLSA